MPDPYDLKALLEKLAQAQSLLDAKANTPELQQKLPKIKAQLESNLRKALEIKTKQEDYLKRLRGEEVAGDKEKEGALDTVLDTFEAEYGLKAELVEDIARRLREIVEEPEPSASHSGGLTH